MMQNNLEGISFDEVTREDGTSYALYRTTLKPRYSKVLFDIFKGYAWLIVVSGLIIFLTNRFPSYWWVSVIPGAVVLGYTAAYLALFIH
ncbi:MAG: hypothetical protein ACXWV2_12980, partial [Chitinophagaceae bacterium]